MLPRLSLAVIMSLMLVLPLSSSAHSAPVREDADGRVNAVSTTITVNTLQDELNTNGNCSLREAIVAVNTDAPVDACPAGNGADTINLPAGTYTLTLPGNDNAALTGDLDITGKLTIVGAGAATTIIDGNGIDRVFDVIAPGTLNLSGVTVRDGSVSGFPGGGIDVELGAALNITDSVIVSNTASTEPGGGIYVEGSAVLRHVTVMSNTANGGGGLVVIGPVSLFDSIVQGNSVGGVFANGPFTATNTTLRNNTGQLGGGLYSGGVSVLRHMTVISNSATVGGGVLVETGSLDLSDSSVLSNTATGSGGGIAVDVGTQLTLTNTTLAQNAAGAQGGGLFSRDTTSLFNVTIAGNKAGGVGSGIGTYTNTTVVLRNSLIASNNGQNCDNGFIIDGGSNLRFGDGSCPATISLKNPLLGALQVISGTTVYPLLAGSPAINAGSSVFCPPDDQRGQPRDSHCDIGAYEYVAPVPSGPFSLFLALLFHNYASPIPGTFETEPNNTAAQANGPLLSSVDYHGYEDDEKDYFRFFLPGTGNITADLSNTSGQSPQLLLYYQNDLQHNIVFAPNPPFHLALTNRPSGWYYLEVFTAGGFNSFTPYTLRVTYP